MSYYFDHSETLEEQIDALQNKIDDLRVALQKIKGICLRMPQDESVNKILLICTDTSLTD